MTFNDLRYLLYSYKSTINIARVIKDTFKVVITNNDFISGVHHSVNVLFD